MTKSPVSVVIPARNEERNIEEALASVVWADEVFVVDSHSTDRTVERAEAGGATVVQFDYLGRGPRKKEWSLRNLPFRNEWVLLLDADERVTPELREEMEAAIARSDRDGYCVNIEFHFLGRRLRCFQRIWVTRLFRHRLGRFEDLGLNDLADTGDNEIHEHVRVDGRLGYLRSTLRHEDRRNLDAWIERHNRYSTWEAHLYRRFRAEPIGIGPLGFLRLDPPAKRRVLRRVWVRVPFRPTIRFLIWYVVRGGFLDGSVGFVFCRLMAWYELATNVKLRELERHDSAS